MDSFDFKLFGVMLIFYGVIEDNLWALGAGALLLVFGFVDQYFARR